jgi:hypothetical protein
MERDLNPPFIRLQDDDVARRPKTMIRAQELRTADLETATNKRSGCKRLKAGSGNESI